MGYVLAAPAALRASEAAGPARSPNPYTSTSTPTRPIRIASACLSEQLQRPSQQHHGNDDQGDTDDHGKHVRSLP